MILRDLRGAFRNHGLILAALLALAASPEGAIRAADPKPNRDYRGAMRAFVGEISAEAKRQRPGFLIVPQGGLDLLVEQDAPAASYIKAIDGVGQEEVFYGFDNQDGVKTPSDETEAYLELLAVAEKAGKRVLSTDYTSKRDQIDDALARNARSGFLSFVADRRGLDGVPPYPARPVDENRAEVRTLADARNFLYLINGGRFDDVGKYLSAVAATNYDLLIIDPFTEGGRPTADQISRLKTKPNGGRRLVLCYVSIGEAEDYRSYWKQVPKALLGPENPDWKGNYAVRYWEPEWRAIFVGGRESYLARVMAAGFDGVYLDKVDEYLWFEENGE